MGVSPPYQETEIAACILIRHAIIMIAAHETAVGIKSLQVLFSPLDLDAVERHDSLLPVVRRPHLEAGG